MRLCIMHMLSNRILTFKAVNFEALKLLHKFIKAKFMQSTKYYNLKNKLPHSNICSYITFLMHIKYNYALYKHTYIIIHVLGLDTHTYNLAIEDLCSYLYNYGDC